YLASQPDERTRLETRNQRAGKHARNGRTYVNALGQLPRPLRTRTVRLASVPIDGRHNMASYWDQHLRRQITRRTGLRGGGLIAAGSAAMALVGCGGKSSSSTSSSGTGTGQQTTPTGAQPVAGGSFTIASSDGGIFDPAMVIHGGTQTIEFAAYDKL